MGVREIRAQIAAVLAGVTGVGRVHEYQRWTKDWQGFLILFKDSDDRIRGWTITREATGTIRDNVPTLERLHRFVLRGHFGLNDAEATELEFQDLLEAVHDAFKDNPTLNGTCRDSEPVRVETVEIRLFGTVLCHYAELSLEAHERAYYS